ncbi:MAG: ribosomal L7Ae/L30e/S12e/Gadd45 family protein [Deltaproteobacteria bacterium]|nr:ribosomal L7Ae/L30e/S12e/Gadd45 family protein [Deltaproteobacteria bacterium]MBQ6669215.1 ribosomal L7Ae/L30e/S12e/Gadd45 family protein [Deltaproteobacteria bacterium]
MPERLKKRAMRVVGVRQTLRAVKEQNADMVFVAMDADPRLRQQVEKEAEANAVRVQLVATMEELAALCRVDVPSAAAAIRKNALPD